MNDKAEFYHTTAWRKCSKAFMQSKNYICERCGGLATICHHKKYITDKNVHDPNITLNWDNLEALCQTCHNQEHFGGTAINKICADGLTFDSDGNLIKNKSPHASERNAPPYKRRDPF